MNRFNNPVKTQYHQTYIDQYVPMPFETMSAALGTRQKVYDDTKANANALLLTHVNALDVDKPLREEILKDISTNIDTLVGESGGDYSKLRGDIAGLTNSVKENLMRGPLGAIQNQYDAFQGDLASKNELVDKGFDKGGNLRDRADLLTNIALDRYNQTGGVRSGGNFSGIAAAAQYDHDRIAQEIVKDMKADGGQSAGWYTGSDGITMRKTKNGVEEVKYEDVFNVSKSKLLSDPRVQDEFQQMRELGYPEDQIEAQLDAVAGRMAETYGFKKTTQDANLKFIPKHIQDERLGVGDYEQPLGLTVPHEAEMFGASDANNTEKLNDVIVSTGAMYEKEGLKIINALGGRDSLGLGDWDGSAGSLMELMKDPNRRATILAEGGSEALDKLDHIKTNYDNLQLRSKQANDWANSKVPEMKVLATTLNPHKDVYNKFGVDPDIIARTEGGTGDRKVEFFRMVDEAARELGYDPAFGTHTTAGARSYVEDLAAKGNATADKYMNAINTLDNYRSKAGDAVNKRNTMRDQWLNNTAMAVPKTQGGQTLIPVYNMDDSGNLTVDKKRGTALTKQVQKVLTDVPQLMSFTGKVKTENGWETINLGTHFGNEDADYSNIRIGKTPSVGKSVNADGQNYISVNINDEEVHIPLTDTQMPEVRDVINPTIPVSTGSGTMFVQPRRVDTFLWQAHGAGVTEKPIGNGEYGTINIPRNPDASSQQGDGSFYNDSNFSVNIPSVGVKTGSEAYNYLLSLQAQGLLN